MTLEERNLAWRQRLRREEGLPVVYVPKFQILKKNNPSDNFDRCCTRIVDPDWLMADRRKRY